MSLVQVYCSNGVSFGTRHVVTSAESTDGSILFDFMPTGTVDGYDLAAAITVTNSVGLVKSGSDETITYPGYGKVQITEGAATCTLDETDVVTVVAQRAT